MVEYAMFPKNSISAASGCSLEVLDEHGALNGNRHSCFVNEDLKRLDPLQYAHACEKIAMSPSGLLSSVFLKKNSHEGHAICLVNSTPPAGCA